MSLLPTETLRFNFGLELQLSRGFKIGDFTIYFYGLIIALGFLLAFIYGMKRCKKFGIDPDRLIDCVIGGIIGGVLGARLYFVAFSWDYYSQHLDEIFSIREGGMAIYGGIIGALLVGLLVAKIRKVRIAPLLDIAGIGFLIGQGIGRWANFVNIEAFGSNTNLPWGMTSPAITEYLTDHFEELTQNGMSISVSDPVHPCFLYESLWCLLGALVLHILSKKRRFDGEVFLLYIGWYGLGRALIEGLRTDSLMLGQIRISQLVAIVCVILSILLVFILRARAKRNEAVLYVDTEESKMRIAKSEEVRRERKADDALTQEEHIMDDASMQELDALAAEMSETGEKGSEPSTTASPRVEVPSADSAVYSGEIAGSEEHGQAEEQEQDASDEAEKKE